MYIDRHNKNFYKFAASTIENRIREHTSPTSVLTTNTQADTDIFSPNVRNYMFRNRGGQLFGQLAADNTSNWGFLDYMKAFLSKLFGIKWENDPLENLKTSLKNTAPEAMRTQWKPEMQERSQAMYNTMKSRYNKQFGGGAYEKDVQAAPGTEAYKRRSAWVADYKKRVDAKTRQSEENAKQDKRQYGDYGNFGFVDSAIGRNAAQQAYENFQQTYKEYKDKFIADTIQTKGEEAIKNNQGLISERNKQLQNARNTYNKFKNYAYAVSPAFGGLVNFAGNWVKNKGRPLVNNAIDSQISNAIAKSMYNTNPYNKNLKSQ